MLKRSKGRPNKERPPGPPVWGLGIGLTTLPHINIMVTKTESDVNETTPLGDIAARTAMTLLGQNPRNPKGP